MWPRDHLGCEWGVGGWGSPKDSQHVCCSFSRAKPKHSVFSSDRVLQPLRAALVLSVKKRLSLHTITKWILEPYTTHCANIQMTETTYTYWDVYVRVLFLFFVFFRFYLFFLVLLVRHTSFSATWTVKPLEGVSRWCVARSRFQQCWCHIIHCLLIYCSVTSHHIVCSWINYFYFLAKYQGCWGW